ncbi:serine/threonine-protein kinase ZRK1-like [Brassica napus]|nr:serine/threonine-protein kinase ZRK1-like [Brassica napus]
MEFWRRKKDKEEARECFLKNGSKYLQKLIADSNGKSNPIQMFSSHQISKATNHFDPKCSLPVLVARKPVTGTLGYVDHIYRSTGIVTEYLDVFSFGIFMLVLRLGRPAFLVESVARWDLGNILDSVKDMQERREPVEFGGDLNEMRPGQMKMFLDLALRCCEKRNEDRPTMISVAKECK